MHPATRRLLAATALLALLPASTLAQAPYQDPILERMRKDIFFLAGPECEGRGIDTKGIDKAADYIAETFKAAGLKPAGPDGSYFQPFTFVASAKAGPVQTFTITGKGETLILADGGRYSPMGFSPASKASGGLVFAGYGITAPNLKYDDYAGLDVAGKVVIVLRKTPRPEKLADGRFDTTTPAGEESPHAALAAKIENAAAHKAAAVVFVTDAATAARQDDLFRFAEHAVGTAPAPFPVLHLKREVLDDLLRKSADTSLTDVEQAIDRDLKPRSVELTGFKADIEVTVSRVEYKVKNVVGYVDGSGPLAGETIVLGAHYDHLGYGQYGSMGGAAARGKVHYGADDNASGTTGLLELARRYGAQKDRQGRRLVFAAFTAEERGLYGSIHYCKNPPFPLETTVAMLNMDMIGRAKPVPSDWLGLAPKQDRLLVYGTGSGDTLEALVDEVGGRHELKISKLAAGTGPSDHDSFYRKKIPVLFFYTGTHDEYHQPTDVPEKINVPGMRKVADLVQDLTDRLASTAAVPKYQVTRDPWTDPTNPRQMARPTGPRLGVRIDYAYEGGVLLEGVTPGGAAEKAGLKEGDVITEIAGKPVANVGAYMAAMAGQKAGQPVEVTVSRKGQKLTLKVTPQ
jgi:hypothetical protein